MTADERMFGPLVSVLIPAFNHEQHIWSCLDSVAKETWARIEVLVSDDCSSDETYAVACQWFANGRHSFERFELTRNSRNLGVAENLNQLISRSQGEYFVTVASDDVLKPGGIQARIEKLQEDRAYLAAIGNCGTIDERGAISESSAYLMNGANLSALASRRYIRAELIMRWSVPGPALLCDRRVLELLGPRLMDSNYIVEDRDLYLRLLLADVLTYTRETVAYYRVHEKNTWRTQALKVSQDILSIEEKHVSKFPPRLRMILSFVALGRRLSIASQTQSRVFIVPAKAHTAIFKIARGLFAVLVRFEARTIRAQ